MSLDQRRPTTYLVTSGRTTSQTTPRSPEFSSLLKLIEAAVSAGVSLVQLREKSLSTRVLQELAANAVELTRDTQTRLLINERFDVALAVGADGVQLTSQSMPVDVVRRIVGNEFLIGVSTHSLAEAVDAKAGGADFVLFGPVYETESKRAFGPPQGIALLIQVAGALKSFPVIAIGGINTSNARECLTAGAVGVAAIGMFEDPDALESIITAMS